MMELAALLMFTATEWYANTIPDGRMSDRAAIGLIMSFALFLLFGLSYFILLANIIFSAIAFKASRDWQLIVLLVLGCLQIVLLPLLWLPILPLNALFVLVALLFSLRWFKGGHGQAITASPR
jgi:hypothetical protein